MTALKTITLAGELHVVNQCGTCGVWHTIPKIVYDCCFQEGGFWHCPNGHSRGWAEGQDERDHKALRLERDRLKQQTAQLQDEIAAERKRAMEAEKKAGDAQRRYVSARKRACAGVCPCCNRTFENVQRHMKTKHPNVVPLEQKQLA